MQALISLRCDGASFPRESGEPDHESGAVQMLQTICQRLADGEKLADLNEQRIQGYRLVKKL